MSRPFSPRLLRLPPGMVEAAERARAIASAYDELSGVLPTGPQVLLAGRVVPGRSVALFGTLPLHIGRAATDTERRDAAEFYRRVKGQRLAPKPGITLWTARLSGILFGVAPAWWQDVTPFLAEQALEPPAELDARSLGYLCQALVSLRMSPQADCKGGEPLPHAPGLAFARASVGSPDERALRIAGFQPLGTIPA